MNLIERILHADEIVEEKKKSLIQYYKEEYGRKFESIIRFRMNNMLYFFESPPLETYAFLKNNPTEYNNTDEFYYLKRLARDYKNITRKLTAETNYNIFLLYCRFFRIKVHEYNRRQEEILSLPIGAYCTKTLYYLNHPNTPKKVKKEIGNTQKEYLTQCSNLNIKPIDNPSQIDTLLLESEKLEESLRTKIFYQSIWGKQLLEKYNYSCIDSIINLEDSGECTNISRTKDQAFIYIPLIRCLLDDNDNLDRLFFHEFRHGIETGINGIGISLNSKNEFDFLNEIRTEKHALNDIDNQEEIFNKGINETVSIYEPFFSVTGTLFEKYRSTFDTAAIINNENILYKTFSTSGLKEYSMYLNEDFFKYLNQVEGIPFTLNRKMYRKKLEKVIKKR